MIKKDYFCCFATDFIYTAYVIIWSLVFDFTDLFNCMPTPMSFNSNLMHPQIIFEVISHILLSLFRNLHRTLYNLNE